MLVSESSHNEGNIPQTINIDDIAGNVSYAVPTLHSTFAIPTPDGSYPHHPSFTACAGTDEAHQEAIIVGKGLALLGWDILTNDKLFSAVKSQWEGQIPSKAEN